MAPPGVFLACIQVRCVRSGMASSVIVAVVVDTSATGSSQSLAIKSVCTIGNPSEPLDTDHDMAMQP